MGTAVIDRSREVLDGTEAEGAMADQLDLVIHAFERAVGNPQPGPGQDAIEMSAELANELLEGLESRAHGRVHPATQVVGTSTRLAVFPEELKGLLEVIGPDDGRIPAHQGGETLPFLGPQVPGVLEQQEPGSLERGFLLAAETVHFTPPHLIHRPVQMLHEMKTVEENLSVRGVDADGFKVGLPHIETDDLDGRRAAPAQFREEPGQGLLGPILSHPEQNPAIQVIDDGQVMMTRATTHLIYAQDVQRPMMTAIQPVGHHALHDGSHALPIQAEVPSRFLPAQMPGQFRYRSGQSPGDPRPSLCPRNGFPLHAAVRTANPSRAVVQDHGQSPEREMLPMSGSLDLVNLGAGLTTPSATQATAPQAIDANDHLLHTAFYSRDPLRFQSQQFPDKGFHEHLVSSPVVVFAQQR